MDIVSCMTTTVSSAKESALSPAAAAQSMRRHGRSFWFASRFLSRQVAADAAELYLFCRTLDDLADDNPTPETVQCLQTLACELSHGEVTNSYAEGLRGLTERHAFPLGAAAHLVAAFVEDGTESLCLQSEADLVRYCFGVAGTVGLMMAPLLGVRSKRAHVHAAHLGIAMQMTNIARDVLEDARNGRRYVPGDWLNNLDPSQIATDPSGRPMVSDAIERLLVLADRYYASASVGFALIPFRSRTAIRIASAIYRAIGTELRASGCAWWGDRIVVPLARKLLLTVSVLAGVERSCSLSHDIEAAALQQPLAHLSGLL